MADQTPLGNLDVVISADWSDLADSIGNAVQSCVLAGQAIEAALNDIDVSPLLAALSSVGDGAAGAANSVGVLAQAAKDSASGVGSLNDATAPLAGSLNDAGDAANSAGGSLGGFGNDASQAAGDAHEAEGGVQGLAEQFVALGEALAVTEGLKEFGQEALTAYGTVQSVTIGLTALTKSAEDADTIIEEVKQLAATEPFAFPEIAPTIQKMVAMGVAANQIPAVMQAVADSSAATGNQFSQVANMLDKMSISGTANARSMTTLGISTTDLGNAMGVTADQATAAFKSLDSQSDRVDVLSQALSKFAGTAVAEAQGISGAWQIFQNTFEEVMVGVGDTLAPVVGAILSFGEAVLTDVKSAIDTFNLLPGPVKETAVAIGIAVAALVPLTALISGAGFAMIGLETAWSTATGILAAFGVTSGAVAVEEGALATAQGVAAVSAGTLAVAEGAAGVAMTGAGAAAAASATGFAALSAASTAALVGLVADVTAAGAAVAVFVTETIPAAGAAILSFATIDVAAASAALGAFATGVIAVVGTALAPLAVAVLAAGAAFAGWELGTWANNNVPGMTALDNKITSMIQHIPLLQTLVNQLSGASVDMMSAAKQAVLIQTLQTALETVGVTIQKGTMNANEYANALLAAAAAHGLLGTAAITAAGTQVTLANGMDAVTAKVNAQKQAVDDARGVMVNFQAAVKNGTATQAELDLATRNYNAAVLALTPNVKAQKDSIDGVTQAMEQAQEKAQSSISVFQDLATAHSGDADAVGLLASAYNKAETAAKAAGIAFASAAGEAAKQKVSFDQAIASTQAMEGALGDLIIQYYAELAAGDDTTAIQEQIALSLKDVQSEVTKTGGTYHNATAELIALNVAGQNAMDNLTSEAAVWQGLAGTVGKTATQTVQMSDAFKKVQTDAAAVGLSVQQVGNSLIYSYPPGTRLTGAMLALLDKLNAAAIASGNFVTIGGKLVPTLSALADAASGANDGVAGANATMNAAGVIISGLGTAATTAAPKVAAVGTAAQDTGAQAQTTGTQIINLNKNMDGIYDTVFTGAPIVTQYGNAIKGVGTAATGAGPQIINLNKNMDGIYETVFTGAPIVTQYGAALTSAGKSAQGAAPNITTIGTAVTGVSAIINGVKFANWETGFFQTGGAATTAATQITSYGTASTNVGNILANVPMKADLAATAFTDVATAAAALPAKFTSVDGAISVMGNSLGEGNQDLITFQQQARNTDGSISNITVSVTGLEDPLNVMGSAAQIAATHVQTMGQYATTCGDECGDLTNEVEDFTNAAPAADSAADNIATGFNTMATAAQNATTQVNALAAADAKVSGSGGGGGGGGDMSFSFQPFSLGGDDILTGGNSPSGQSIGTYNPTQVSQTINGATTTGGWTPPPDPNPGRDHLVDNASTVAPGTNPYSWVANATPTPAAAAASASAPAAATPLGNQPVTPVATVPAAVDNTVATQANTAATTANTGAASSNSTALGTGTTAVTAYTGSINLATGAYTAGTQAVTNFGNAVPLGTAAVNQFIEGIQTYTPVIAGVTDTTTQASQAIQANALAFAGSTSATGAATAAQIEAMYEAEGFSKQMAIAGADAVLGIQNTTTAMVPYAQAVGTLTTASRALSDSFTGSSGLQPAVDSTTASFASSVSASDALTNGLGDATTAFAGSSGLNKAVTSIDTAISGPSGLTGALGNLTDAAGQAAGALKSVGTSGGIATSSNPSPGTTTTVTAGPQPPGTGWTLNASGTGWVGGTLPVVPAQVTSGSGTPGGVTPYTPNYPTNLTSADFLGSSGYGTPPTKEQQDYATALAASTDAANAYTDALNSGTDSTDQLFALKQAAVSAWQGLQSMTGGFSETASQASGAAASLGLLDGTVLTSTANMQLATGGLGAFGQELVNATAIIGNQVISKQFSANDPNLTTGLAELAAGLIPGGTAGSEGQVTSPAPLTIQQLNNEISAGIVTPTGTPTPSTTPYLYTPDQLLEIASTLPASDLIHTNAPVNLTVQVNAGTVVGSNAAQQLVNMVMPQMVAQLRQAGVKI